MVTDEVLARRRDLGEDDVRVDEVVVAGIAADASGVPNAAVEVASHGLVPRALPEAGASVIDPMATLRDD